MLPKLTCYHCHQKTVDETATGYACAACGQSWASLQDFIRARFAELSQSIESASAQPTGPEPTRIAPGNAGAGNPRLGLIALLSPG